MKFWAQICAACLLLLQTTAAQTVEVTARPLTDSDIELLRSNVQTSKNDVISHTMQFTPAESDAFWPIYRSYSSDQRAIADERLQLIKDYAKEYDTMNDAKAKDMVQRFIAIENKTAKLRDEYWPKFENALGAKKAAKFYQVDNRLTTMVNLQLSSEIPLIP